MFLAQNLSLAYIYGWAKWKGYINYILGMTNVWKLYLESIQRFLKHFWVMGNQFSLSQKQEF
jgi:hypothetical protein